MFTGFAKFYWHFIQDFSKIIALLTSILKTSPQLAGTLLATGITDSDIVGSNGGKHRKSAKSDFIKPVHGAEEPSFLTSNAR